MKKAFVFAMAVLFMWLTAFGTVRADTEGLDVSGLTDDALVSLMELVNEELVKRGIEKTAVLAKGAYLVGIDIPAGKYLFTCLAKGDDWGNVTVRSEGGEGKQLLWDVVSAPGEGEPPETIFMALQDGDQLSSQVPFSLTIQTAIRVY